MRQRAPAGKRRRARAIPEGIRITKVGLWYVLVTLVVAVAATNTGNNALYRVWAAMLAALVVSGFLSRQNVRRLSVHLNLPPEAYANRPLRIPFAVTNRGGWWSRWFLLISIFRKGQPSLLPFLPRGGTGKGELELILLRRGVHPIDAVHVSSLFPFGLFRKGARYRVDQEILAYPELFDAAAAQVNQSGDYGRESVSRPGWGHDLHGLRRFRVGDDPRGIHWKQTARTGRVIYLEREAEESRRLSVVFENGVGELDDSDREERFERLVSEAATTAVDYLERGFEVELVTRAGIQPFSSGRLQRLKILEALALIQPSERVTAPLQGSDTRAPEVRLTLDGAVTQARAVS